MRYFYLLLPVLLFSCSSNTESESPAELKLNLLTKENDSLQTIVAASDTISQKSLELMQCVTDMTYLTKLWVANQTRADTQDKQTLLHQELHCQLLLEEMKLHLHGEGIDSSYQKVSDASQEYQSLVSQVKTFLSSFASYEDPVNFMSASILVENDGPLDSAKTVLINSVTDLFSRATSNGDLGRLTIARNKEEMKLLAAEENREY